MSDEGKKQLFRKKAVDNISSPEDLNSYLKVTNPSVWIVLVAIIALLVGLFVWSMVGKLETTADAIVSVSNNRAMVVVTGRSNTELAENMLFRIDSDEYTISSVIKDDYGITEGFAEVSQPDGTYVGEVVLEQTYPIKFLMESR